MLINMLAIGYGIIVSAYSTLTEPNSKIVYRCKEFWDEGIIRTFIVRFKCFKRKLTLRGKTFTLLWVRLDEVSLSHMVSPSPVLTKRINRFKHHIAITDNSKLDIVTQLEKFPSDYPITLVKEAGSYVVVEGNGRITAAKSAGITHMQVLVFEERG